MMTNEQIGEELKREAEKYTSTIPKKAGKGYTTTEKVLSSGMFDSEKIVFIDFLNRKIIEILNDNKVEHTKEQKEELMEYMNPIFHKLIGEFVGLAKL